VPDTLTGFGVFLLAVLPGGLYVWSFERVVGRWGIGLSDRLLRIVAASAVFIAAFSYPLYLGWRSLKELEGAGDSRSIADLITDGEPVPWWVYLLPLAYVITPFVLGTWAGRAVRSSNARWKSVGRIISGKDPAPRAWDFLFSSSPGATIRMRLKDEGTWVGGQFGEDSYAAGYPEEPQDLFLEMTYAMDQEDGSFTQDENGDFVEIGSGLMIRWSEVQFLEVFPLQEES
jgi:hypothetical protein